MNRAKSKPRAKSYLPDHQYATDHRLSIAAHEVGARRRIRDAADIRPSGEIACARIREFAYDLGADLEWHRWIAEVARRLGLPYGTAYSIVTGHTTTLSTRTVDKIARTSGIPYSVFYDDEI